MIFIMTGPIHSGKTTRLMELTQDLERKGIACSGYLSLSVRRGDRVEGYDLFELPGGKTHPFLRRTSHAGEEKTGPFSLIPETLLLAQNSIRNFHKNMLGIIDELGPLELNGGGVWPALNTVISKSGLSMIWVIRKSLLAQWEKKLSPFSLRFFDFQDRALSEEVLNHFKPR